MLKVTPTENGIEIFSDGKLLLVSKEDISVLTSELKKYLGKDDKPLFRLCKQYYQEYCEKNELECYWEAKHSAALKKILNKLKASYLKRNGTQAEENELYQSFKYFIDHLPDWYKGKGIAVLNSCYDTVVNGIVNKRKTSIVEQKRRAFDKIDNMFKQ